MSESANNFTYRAFISYSHRDKAWADWLHKALETYRVPSRLVGKETTHGTIPRRLHPVFRDRDELSSSPELGSKINAALAQSANLIVICSPASATSRWVNEEVLAWKRMGRAERIFCLIVDGEPDASDLSGREAEECFCPALRYQYDADGQRGARNEPIAADARPGKDGKPNAKLKLIAGMLDVGFDQLKQREQQRRVRRMTAITSIALAVMAVTIVLAAYALVSRHRAVIAQHQAQVAQQAAQRRQKQAEGLIDFMLGDLTYKLAAESHLDIMQDVDDKAMAYFDSLPPTDVNDTALVHRAETLEKIGGNRMQQGNLTGALEAFRASTAISSRLANAAPGDVARHVAWSRTLTWIGMAYQIQLKLADANDAYARARVALQPALQAAPGNLDLLQQLSYVDNNEGQVLQARGDPEAARRDYESMLQAARKLIAANPADIAYGQIIIKAHENLADQALQRGDLATAIARYHAALAAATATLDKNPHDNYGRDAVADAIAEFHDALPWVGGAEPVTWHLDRAIGMAQGIVKSDPGNADFQRDLGKLSLELARVERIGGDLRAAAALNARSLKIFANLAKADATNREWPQSYASALIEQAAQARAQGDANGAAAAAQYALGILKPLLAQNPDEREI
ncbi:MAG: TIR domain-containing protein, partial [Proteobacteria bacterium]|nr:TIR domain-containing protein [Pseudomonadota bacterium]